MTVTPLKKTDEKPASQGRFLLSPINELIEEARNGRMFILVDDEDRENEGDLVIPAQMATPDAINFMAAHGRGLICLAMDRAMTEKLGLKLMPQTNRPPLSTAFTISIEAKTGVSTGISAPDRARTVQVAIDPESTPADIVTPGHIFPLIAQEGGTLVRAGHTEAAVDIARLAGLRPAGVICEIMKDDGEMARLDDLGAFAQTHNLKIGTIADLIAYRFATENLIDKVSDEATTLSRLGEVKILTYRSGVDGGLVKAIVKGRIDGAMPVPVRVHNVDVVRDAFSGGQGLLDAAAAEIAQAGQGVIVLFDDTGRDGPVLRHTGIGAQILRDIGVKDMILLTSGAKTVIGLAGFGLNITDQKTIQS